MNLITNQQHSFMNNDPIIVHVPEIERFKDDEGNLKSRPIGPDRFWTDDYGVIGAERSAAHQRGPGRPCVHLLEGPYHCEFLGAAWINQLSWQPAIYSYGQKVNNGTAVSHGAHTLIACRRGDIFTLGFDVVGPIAGCRRLATKLDEANKFYYRLHPIIFDDQPDEIFDRAYIGVQVD